MFSIEGIIANTGKRQRIDIDTKSGLIAKVSEPTGEGDVILKEELIFPGFIDLHVHAREDMSHTQDYKEDFVSAGEAAINGGVVAFLDMPNNPVAPVDDKSYEEKNNLTKKCGVNVLLYGGIGPNTKPLSRTVPYKVFMGPSVGELFFTSREDLEKVISNYEHQYISFHCEEPKILDENKNAFTHEDKRPKEAEISAVEFALYLIEKYKINGKICHASTKEGLDKIIEARRKGLPVTVEVTPHHLYFDETMIGNSRKIFQVNPPIRQSKENRLALIEMLRRGDIDYIATDHAPHTVEEKKIGISGLTHLDTYGAFTTWLMKEHSFTREDIVRVCSQNPGRFLNNFSKEHFGEIRESSVGSLTVIDMEKTIKISKDNLKTRAGWSPFEGVIFPGSVVMTIIKGKILKNESR